MKRLVSGLMALVMTLVLAAGCSQSGTDTNRSTDVGTQEPPSGIFYDVTGIDPNSTAVTVGDVEIPTDMYLYWLAYACSNLEYNLNMYHMYGMYEEMFDEDGNLLWDADFVEGSTLAEQARVQANSNVCFYAAIEGKAKELGIELDDADRAALEESFAETIEMMGGEEEFQKNLELMGISKESFDRTSGDGRLFEKLLEQITDKDGALYMPAEEYEGTAAYTDHILLMTIDQASNEPLSDEEIAEKYATAQDLLSQLQNAGDGELETLFDSLAAEYSEDPGRAAGKGYVVTPETSFVQEYLDTAFALEPGQVSDIVESSYGYHIIYRRNLADAEETAPDQLSALAEDHLYELLEEYQAPLTPVYSEAIEGLNVSEFYTAYNAKVEEISAANEPADDTGDGAEDNTDNADGTDAGDGTDSGAAAEE